MRRGHLLLWTASVSLAAIAGALILRFNPLGVLHPCPLRSLTGIPCPACGGTASLFALLSGDITGAVRANPMVGAVTILVGCSGFAALILLPWAPRLRLPRPPSGILILAAVLGFMLANWFYLYSISR